MYVISCAFIQFKVMYMCTHACMYSFSIVHVCINVCVMMHVLCVKVYSLYVCMYVCMYVVMYVFNCVLVVSTYVVIVCLFSYVVAYLCNSYAGMCLVS